MKKILVVILVIIMAGAGYMFLKDRFEKKSQETVMKERDTWQQKTETLQKEIGSLEKKVEDLGRELQTQEQGPAVDTEKQVEAFGEEVFDFYGKEPGNVPAKIRKFFSYIDRKGYLKARGIEGTAYEYFKGIVARLQQSTPVISGETQDAYILLKNISFFFRVLGKTDVLLIKDIIAGETEIMEPTMKLFCLWMDPSQIIEDRDRITVPLDVQYEYAAFFLQTIAGKAYLFRRDSKIRQLTTYYCILILDKANNNTLNKYGVDIRPPVFELIQDMQNYKLLADKKTYLNNLGAIKKKAEGIKLERPADETSDVKRET